MLDSAVLLEEADQAVSEAARIVAAPHLYPEPAIHRARVLLRIGTSRAVDVDSTVQAIATERRTAPASSVIAGAWKPLDPSLLTTAPPARRWLLRHPTRDGAPCAQIGRAHV